MDNSEGVTVQVAEELPLAVGDLSVSPPVNEPSDRDFASLLGEAFDCLCLFAVIPNTVQMRTTSVHFVVLPNPSVGYTNGESRDCDSLLRQGGLRVLR